MIQFHYQPKSKQVIRRVSDKAERVGKRFGGYVRRTAKQSIRRTASGKPAAPGKPPRSQTGTLKRFILFAYDKEERAVLVGPTVLPDRNKEAPESLEKGGESRTTVYINGAKVKRKIKVKRRPFMEPALEKRLPDLLGLWQGDL